MWQECEDFLLNTHTHTLHNALGITFAETDMKQSKLVLNARECSC